MAKAKKSRQDNLRAILQEKKRKVWGDIRQEIFGKLGDEYRQQFDTAMDLGDLSFVDVLQSIGINLVKIRQEELAKIDQAERKLEAGTYGLCEECGAEIPHERLLALPFAVRCVRCEQELEKIHAGSEPVGRRRIPEE